MRRAYTETGSSLIPMVLTLATLAGILVAGFVIALPLVRGVIQALAI